MSNYKLITDEKALDNFIDWLPDLRKDNHDNEVFYLCLFARKKYFKYIISSSNDKTQLRRELVKKHSIKREVKKWECALGTYQLKKDTVPQEALAVYITPNPRSMRKAMFNLTKDLVEFMSKENIPHNLHQNAISAVQRSRSRTEWVDFDIDTKDVNLTLLKKVLPECTYRVLETRGGYHILVNPIAATAKLKSLVKHNPSMQDKGIENWYRNIQKTFDVDQSGDNMIPIPGTFQGNFIPKFIDV